ncbi:Uncharacterised protein [Acinetobacter baumannii]|nr:Uncharacterised protein [Acinetobacter baumannii]
MPLPIQMPSGPISRMAIGAAISTISIGLRKFLVTAGVMRSTPRSMCDRIQVITSAGITV